MFVTLTKPDHTHVAVNVQQIVAMEEKVEGNRIIGSILRFTMGEPITVLETLHQILANIPEWSA